MGPVGVTNRSSRPRSAASPYGANEASTSNEPTICANERIARLDNTLDTERCVLLDGEVRIIDGFGLTALDQTGTSTRRNDRRRASVILATVPSSDVDVRTARNWVRSWLRAPAHSAERRSLFQRGSGDTSGVDAGLRFDSHTLRWCRDDVPLNDLVSVSLRNGREASSGTGRDFR